MVQSGTASPSPGAGTGLFWKLPLIALAYFAAGELGLELAIPPGYATAIWPPSGIALAAVIVWGAGVWPGIALGSFFINVWTGLDAGSTGPSLQSLAMPMVIALGASAQAVAGRYLLRRFGGISSALDEPEQIGRLILLGGGAACLVNCTLSVGMLFLTGRIPAENAFYNWMTWWVGDAIGVMIFTPLCLILGSKQGIPWRRAALLVGSLATCFALTVVLVFHTLGTERRELAARCASTSVTLGSMLTRAVSSRLDAVGALEALFAANEHVPLPEFRQFASRIRTRMAGLAALEWIARVPTAERAEFERRMTTETGETVTIRDTSPAATLENPDFYPVTFVEPAEGNRKAVGFDLGSSPARRAALTAAAESGEPVLSERIQLVQSGEQAVLIAVPVYRADAGVADVESRRAALKGFALGVVRISDLVGSAFTATDAREFRYWLRDETDPSAPVPLYANTDGDPAPFAFSGHGLWGTALTIGTTETLSVGGRTWVLRMAPTQVFLGRHFSSTAWQVLLAGLLFTGILGAFVLMVTGREQSLRRQVAERTRDLNEAVRAKSDFLAMMSHEIRTPITGVLGMADLMRKTPLSGEQRGYLDTLGSCTRTLLAVLNDILDLSKIEANKVEIRSANLRPRQVAGDTLELCRSMAVGKPLSLVVALAEDIPDVVVGDETRLRQVLYNLLGNAIKFTESGTITLRMSVAQRHGDTVTILTEIMDSGIGLTPDEIKRLFQPFTQLDSSSTRRFGGTGLGLAITKRLVDLMGGEIGVESAPGAGSRFWFTVPFQAAVEAPPEPAAVPDPPPDAPGPLRILLAEDNAINQMLVTAMLRKSGHAVEAVANGRLAVEAVATRDFDMVLMDMQMPEMDGVEAARTIRSLPSPRNRIPIIALTADVMSEHRSHYLEAGIDGVVPKPIDWTTLSQEMAKLLGR